MLLNNEYYNKEDGKVIADTIFSIGTVKYHFECQYSNDKSMVFRMFEYDFHVAVSKIKEEEEYFEFSCLRRKEKCKIAVFNLVIHFLANLEFKIKKRFQAIR